MAVSNLPPIGSPERQAFLQRMFSDTGFFCRHVLGMDTDRDEHGNCTSEIGKGGVRDHGPHQQLVSFLDDETPGNEHRMVWAPRYAYKSSILRGFIDRKIISHPNISILLFMHEQEAAAKRCLEIREELVNNPILRELFPNMRGHLWRNNEFITGLRTDKAGDSCTLYAASPRYIPTGTRPNIVIFDDIVSDQSITENALKMGRRCVEKSLFLGSRGCLYIDVGTPYHYGDAHHMILERPTWKKLIHLDVGYDLVVRDDKSLDLTGDGTWPNLSKEFLLGKLRAGVSFHTFMSQYKLKVVADVHQTFQRRDFQPCHWREEFAEATGYLLSDVAPGHAPGEHATEAGCLNVLMYVVVTAKRKIIVLDCEVGRWQQIDFVDRYINMLERWSGRVNHRAELWESNATNTGYASYLGLRAKERNRRTNVIWAKRTRASHAKDHRIACSAVHFQAGEVYICTDTMPRQWNDGTSIRDLWGPESYRDPESNATLPGGDFVEQFIRFPFHQYKDIPDTFSLIDSTDHKTGQFHCFYVKASRFKVPEADLRQTVSPGPLVGSSGRFYSRLRKKRHA